MRLLNKTGLYYIGISAVVCVIAGVIFYFSIQKIINEAVEENLYNEKANIIKQLKTFDSIPRFYLPSGDKLEIIPAGKNEKGKDVIRNVTIYDKSEDEDLPYAQLVFYSDVKGKTYKITISQLLLESEDLISTVVSSMFILMLALFLSLLLINLWISKKLWKPFYDTIDKLKMYQIAEGGKLNLTATNISEFEELNSVINRMTDKMYSDYVSLKKFTENAAHEIQTPLAIIKSKLEILMQHENIDGEQMKLIHSIYESSNRLSKLNQGLLLLTKIKNRQFAIANNVDMNAVIEKKLENFEDIIKIKGISIIKNLNENVKLNISPLLADILISNLLNNAIKYNVDNGKIEIILKTDRLVVSNSGLPLKIKPDSLFERFSKDNDSSESLGLGLSIVKEICDNYNFGVNYNYSNNTHEIEIKF
ncbi:MAG: HAMP domain-containing sensor histidine kinase [Bacteroidales bacterium]|nr:HAMP domain-containing sensor histidine kinase [Bacteroidales bacterium]